MAVALSTLINKLFYQNGISSNESAVKSGIGINILKIFRIILKVSFLSGTIFQKLYINFRKCILFQNHLSRLRSFDQQFRPDKRDEMGHRIGLQCFVSTCLFREGLSLSGFLVRCMIYDKSTRGNRQSGCLVCHVGGSDNRAVY